MTSGPSARRVRTATAVGLAVGAVVYLLALFDYRLDWGRTAVRLGYASNFFDLQAEAFLDGRIDLPPGSLGIEGFVVDGRTFMYFPPFPALLRVPVMLLTSAFDGRLSLVSMAVAWLLFATMTAHLLWLVRRCVRGEGPVGRFEAAAAAVFLAAATGGTVVTFDAALPWVYHEVYVWAVALVVGALYWLVRLVVEPTRATAVWLGLFTGAAALTRTTGGWALCIVTVGVAIWFASGRLGPVRRARWRLPALAGGLPWVAAVAYNMAKFGHPYLFPLENQVWTSVNEHRRDALAANGGTITGPQFFVTSLVNYFRPDGIRFVEYFPYVTLPAEPAQAYAGAYLDQAYRTGSVTAFTPLLVLLTLAAVPVLLRRTDSVERKALRPAVLAAGLVGGGVMAYGYLAYRYTSEFVPLLVVGGAVGLFGLVEVAGRVPRPARTAGLALAAGLAAFSIVAQSATAHAVAAQTWRGDRLRDFVALQHRLSGGPGSPLGELVRTSDALPPDGPTDELRIVGDCDALYLGTGDTYEPWLLVEQRPQVVEVAVSERLRTGRALLATVHGTRERRIVLETRSDQFARVVIASDAGEYAGPWFPVYTSSTFRVGVGFETDLGYALVTSTPGGFVGYVPYIEWDADWNARPGRVDFAVGSEGTPTRQGVRLTRVPGLPLTLCERLRSDLAADASR